MSFNIVLYNGHIVLHYTTQFVYSSLNSYVYIHWILDFKYILLFILMLFMIENNVLHELSSKILYVCKDQST